MLPAKFGETRQPPEKQGDRSVSARICKKAGTGIGGHNITTALWRGWNREGERERCDRGRKKERERPATCIRAIGHLRSTVL